MEKVTASILRNGVWYVLGKVEPCRYIRDKQPLGKYCSPKMCEQKEATIGVYKNLRSGRKLVTTKVCLMKNDDIFKPEPRYGVVNFVSNARYKARRIRRMRVNDIR